MGVHAKQPERVQRIIIPYTPRAQFMPFHLRKERWSVLVVHRRAGKTVAAINDLVKRCMECDKLDPRFAYVAPTYAQAKDVAWSYLKRFTEPIPGRVVSEAELHITLPGNRRIRLYGADNYDRMRGVYFDGVVVDEPADMDPAAWYDVIRPALSDRLGWCVWIGTPKGRDAFYRLWKQAVGDAEWYTMRLPASQSGLLPQSELDSAKAGMTAVVGAYEREYECSFETPVAGSIYGDLFADLRAKQRIKNFEYDRGLPVFSSWDLGWNDCTSVWLFQTAGPEIYWIWHTRQSKRTAGDMAVLLRETGIPIESHYLPHDADSATAATGISYRSALIAAGLTNVKVIPRSVNIWDGINALRRILPQSWFHAEKCAMGIEAMEAYHSKETGGVNGKAIAREPVHDWASHCADAARYVAEALSLGMVRAGSQKMQVEIFRNIQPGDPVDVGNARRNAAVWGGRLSAQTGFRL